MFFIRGRLYEKNKRHFPLRPRVVRSQRAAIHPSLNGVGEYLDVSYATMSRTVILHEEARDEEK